jgi:hypothetical protein
MTVQQTLQLIETCPLVEDCRINDDQVYFHLVGVDPDNVDECSEKGREFELWLRSKNIDTTNIMWNDCEECYHEGTLNV